MSARPRRRPPDRKGEIVRAAVARLAAEGFEGFRLGDVAADVGINKATLIHHFSGKEELVCAVVERFAATFAAANAGPGEGGPRERLERHLRASLGLMASDPAMFVVLGEIMMRARRDAGVRAILTVMFDAWYALIGALVVEDAAPPGPALSALAEACMTQLVGIAMATCTPEGGALWPEGRAPAAAEEAVAALLARFDALGGAAR